MPEDAVFDLLDFKDGKDLRELNLMFWKKAAVGTVGQALLQDDGKYMLAVRYLKSLMVRDRKGIEMDALNEKNEPIKVKFDDYIVLYRKQLEKEMGTKDLHKLDMVYYDFIFEQLILILESKSPKGAVLQL